jgi:hypothetical protein
MIAAARSRSPVPGIIERVDIGRSRLKLGQRKVETLRACRSFEVQRADGDAEYEVGWGRLRWAPRHVGRPVRGMPSDRSRRYPTGFRADHEYFAGSRCAKAHRDHLGGLRHGENGCHEVAG